MAMKDGRPIRLREVELPDFGMPEASPRIPVAVHEERLAELLRRADAGGYDHVVVYADREHSANLSYLTGFDPRFEEALLVIRSGGDPSILVGNECVGMAEAAPLHMDVQLFPELSLPGQPDRVGATLQSVLATLGIGSGDRIGVVGWKGLAGPNRIDLPAFVVDDLRALTGSSDLVVNATDMLINAADGMRSSTRSSSWRTSSTPPVRPHQGCVDSSLTSSPASPNRKRCSSCTGAEPLSRVISCSPPGRGRRSGCSARATGSSEGVTL